MSDLSTSSLIIEYETGQATPDMIVELFSRLISTGQAWQLQGHYGRTAKLLIEQGIIDKDGTINDWEEL